MPRRVLVVDDEMQIREILRAYLAAEGFLVQEAATGAQVCTWSSLLSREIAKLAKLTRWRTPGT